MHPRKLTRGALVGALLAVVVAGPCASTSAAAAPDAPATRESAPVRDGSHDFDFIYGKWRMPNHRLKKRLAGSHEWVDFVTCDEGRPLPGGIGDTDSWRASFWKDFVGIALRTYDAKTGLWRIYWVDNTFSRGVIGPPVIGKFDGNLGKFEGRDTENGVPVLVRFTWTLNPTPAQVSAPWEKAENPSGAKVVAKWEQAFSADGGKTWETNWYNEFIHDDNCTPTS